MSLATSANGRLCCRSGLLPIRLAWRAFRTAVWRRRTGFSARYSPRSHREWSMQSPPLPGRPSPLSTRSLRAGAITSAQHWGVSIAESSRPGSRRVSESANVPPIFVTCRKHRETVDFALVGLSVGRGIYQQHTKKKDQIEHRKHEQATSRLPLLVLAPTYLP